MNLFGMSIRVGGFRNKLEVSVDRHEIAKETEKYYTLRNGSGLVFNCLIRVDKTLINKVQADSDRYIDIIERRIWLVDEDVNEQEVLELLKKEVMKEIEKRRVSLNTLEQQVVNG